MDFKSDLKREVAQSCSKKWTKIYYSVFSPHLVLAPKIELLISPVKRAKTGACLDDVVDVVVVDSLPPVVGDVSYSSSSSSSASSSSGGRPLSRHAASLKPACWRLAATRNWSRWMTISKGFRCVWMRDEWKNQWMNEWLIYWMIDCLNEWNEWMDDWINE